MTAVGVSLDMERTVTLFLHISTLAVVWGQTLVGAAQVAPLNRQSFEHSSMWPNVSHQDAEGRNFMHTSALRGKTTMGTTTLRKLKEFEAVDVLAAKDQHDKNPLQYLLRSSNSSVFAEWFKFITASDECLLRFGGPRLLDCVEGTQDVDQQSVRLLVDGLIRLIKLHGVSVSASIQNEIDYGISLIQRALETQKVFFIKILLDKLCDDVVSGGEPGYAGLTAGFREGTGALAAPVWRGWIDLIELCWGKIPSTMRTKLLTESQSGKASFLESVLRKGLLQQARILLSYLSEEQRLSFFTGPLNRRNAESDISLLEDFLNDGRLDLVGFALEEQNVEINDAYNRCIERIISKERDDAGIKIFLRGLKERAASGEEYLSAWSNQAFLKRLMRSNSTGRNFLYVLLKAGKKQRIDLLLEDDCSGIVKFVEQIKQYSYIWSSEFDELIALFREILSDLVEQRSLSSRVQVVPLQAAEEFVSCIHGRLGLEEANDCFMLLKALLPQYRLSFLQTRLGDQETLLYRILRALFAQLEKQLFTKRLAEFILLLPPNQRGLALRTGTMGWGNVLYETYKFGGLECAKELLELVPEHELLAVMVFDRFGNDTPCLLHDVFEKGNQGSLALLKRLPEEERGEAMLSVNNEGVSLLDFAIHNRSIILARKLLLLIPKQNRLVVLRRNRCLSNNFKSGAIAEKELYAMSNLLKLLGDHERETLLTENTGQPGSFSHTFLLAYEDKQREILDVLREILRLVPLERRCEILLQKDEGGKTFFSKIVEKSVGIGLSVLLKDMFSKKQCKNLLCSLDDTGSTVFHSEVWLSKDSLIKLQLMSLLLPEDKTLLFFLPNRRGNTALHCASELGAGDAMQLLQAIIPEEQWREAILKQNNLGYNVLHSALLGDNLGVLRWFASKFSEEELSVALKQLPSKAYTDVLLPTAIRGSEATLEYLWTVLPAQDFQNTLGGDIKPGDTLLHTAVDTGKISIVKLVLESQPDFDRAKLLKARRGTGDSVYHQIVRQENEEMLEYLLKCLPEQDREEALLLEGNFGDTVLHAAVKTGNKDMLNLSFKMVPELDSGVALSVKGGSAGETMCHLAARRQNEEILMLLLGKLSTEDRFRMLLTKDDSGDAVIHLVGRNYPAEFLLDIFAMFTEPEQYELLKTVDRKKRTLLHIASLSKFTPEQVKLLLDGVTRDEQVELLSMCDMYGSTPWGVARYKLCYGTASLFEDIAPNQ